MSARVVALIAVARIPCTRKGQRGLGEEGRERRTPVRAEDLDVYRYLRPRVEVGQDDGLKCIPYGGSDLCQPSSLPNRQHTHRKKKPPTHLSPRVRFPPPPCAAHAASPTSTLTTARSCTGLVCPLGSRGPKTVAVHVLRPCCIVAHPSAAGWGVNWMLVVRSS